MNPALQFARTRDGMRIAYAVHGSGPPLVFVRGWISHLEQMWDDTAVRAYMEALGRCYRVVRFDMRGNGLSDREMPPISLDGMLADLEAVMDAAAPEPSVLYGQCYGGPAAIAYAVAHPARVSRLVLDGTYADGREITSPRRQEQILATLRDLPEAGLLLLSHYTKADASPGRFHQVERGAGPIDTKTAAALYAFGFNVDVTEMLPEVQAPTLVLHRRDTRAIPLRLGRELATNIAGARFVVLEGTAHNPWDEAPGAALSAIGEFLGCDIPLAAPVAVQREASGGLLTIMFTDMERSTDLTAALGDERAQTIRREHDAVVRRALDAHNGIEVKHTGDGMMATFDSAARAIECAMTIQRSFAERNERAEHAVLVRVGINAGEPIAEAGDVFGTAVITASRIMGQAQGGEILASNVVRELCAGKGFLFNDRGLAALKGFEEPVHIYAVKWD